MIRPPLARALEQEQDDEEWEPAAAQRPRGGVRGTKEFLDPLYVQPGSVHCGCASQMTDGYALGLSLLVTVTGLGRPPSCISAGTC